MASHAVAAIKRINSVDILRGIVMVIMALDHTRDYFSNYVGDPTDLQRASTVLFFTRWITHFCAPVFIFLSGTSAFLSQGRGRTIEQESWRLLTRGLWLILLEITVIRFGWIFNVDYQLVILQVIWAIGVSMVALAAMIFLPRPVILTIGLVMIFGHNLLDSIKPAGGMAAVWNLLHMQGPISYGNGRTIFVIYPIIPWIGVMATGYCFGALFRKEGRERDRLLYLTGATTIGLFIIVRMMNGYGDPSHWHAQPTWWRTALSFINCTKYPPSLLYLLMTLGPAILLMPLMEKMTGAIGNVFKVYGRVPLFYYILHIYLLHTMSVLCVALFKPLMVTEIFSHPGYALPVVYVLWLLAVGIMYFPCRWFMQVKINNRQWWLSYL